MFYKTKILFMKNTKEEIMKKWEPIFESIGVTNSHWSNLSQLAQNQEDFVVENNTSTQTDSIDFPLLPIAKEMAAQTIGLDLVSVQPIGGGNSSTELEKIRNEVKVENRDRIIESISEGKDFEEMKVEDHPDYVKLVGPQGQLFYIDFKYDGMTNSNTN